MTPYPLIFSVYVLETRIFFSHNHGMSNKNTNFSTILLSNPQSNAQALPVTPPPQSFSQTRLQWRSLIIFCCHTSLMSFNLEQFLNLLLVFYNLNSIDNLFWRMALNLVVITISLRLDSGCAILTGTLLSEVESFSVHLIKNHMM